MNNIDFENYFNEKKIILSKGQLPQTCVNVKYISENKYLHDISILDRIVCVWHAFMQWLLNKKEGEYKKYFYSAWNGAVVITYEVQGSNDSSQAWPGVSPGLVVSCIHSVKYTTFLNPKFEKATNDIIYIINCCSIENSQIKNAVQAELTQRGLFGYISEYEIYLNDLKKDINAFKGYSDERKKKSGWIESIHNHPSAIDLIIEVLSLPKK